MKKFIYILLIFIAVVAVYFAIYDHLKTGGVEILKDNSSQIQKHSQIYLHYKVFNNKLLKDYGCDFREIVVDKNKYDIKPIKLREGAKTFVVVVLDKKGDILNIKMSKGLHKIFDSSFIKRIKSEKYVDMKVAVVKIIESFLDREIEFKN